MNWLAIGICLIVFAVLCTALVWFLCALGKMADERTERMIAGANDHDK